MAQHERGFTMSLIKRAKRSNIPLKLGLRGASGSGKTYSSILLAKGLMGGSLSETAILDTENASANLYAHLGDYGVLPFGPPFKPQRYIDAIKYCIDEGVKCLIIDSTSHEWDGEGGCLDIHSSMTGNSFMNWKKVTPMHNAFIQAILQAPIHVLCTMRTKQEYALEQNDKGKVAPTKVGMKEIQRDGFEYELTAVFNIDQNHMATMSKDRTNLFSDGVPFKITEETGKMIAEWNS